MAKKKKEEVTEEPQVETVVVEAPTPIPTPVVEKPKKKGWEFKDRVYYLKGNKKPLSRSIRNSNVYWFDEDKGVNREIKYCQNKQTPFVDEMIVDQRMAHIIFRSGSLFVPKEEVVLQKILSIYHPDKDLMFYEWKAAEVAEHQIDQLELEADAIIAARDCDIEMAEAIMRVENGSEVSNMSSKEIKRDLLIFARQNPNLFLELLNDDNVTLRNFGIKATELGIIKLSNDQRYFKWGSTDRKIMTIPFDEHPYTALAHWFKTDEGMEIYSNIEKRLN